MAMMNVSRNWPSGISGRIDDTTAAATPAAAAAGVPDVVDATANASGDVSADAAAASLGNHRVG